MKYMIYQMDVVVANPKENQIKIEKWVEAQVTKSKPDTIVLPEMWNAGYALDQLEELADDNGEVTIPFLRNLASKHDINIIAGSIANKKGKAIYNTSYIFNRSGELVYEYDKVHLVPMLNEPKYLNGGEQKAKIFELDGVKMGVIICYDLRFPELMRSLALQGAEVIHVVAQWPTSRKEHWKYLQYARAIENQCYVISANSSGTCNGTNFAGESLVINPSGELVTSGPPEKEATVETSIDLSIVEEIRSNIPVFTSRVPHLYGE
ncbi:carbon-nitrogen family hydrolase [Gracilibacillus kekensis]|uniref:Predicted amidohydrolase n=1 Tax=Gracilibacillus kekensis TaxID=1027249 RepID=A0A1M7PYS5_9BACI|nr:carbon-nitrogen family hydrolase [Gracilibacillus kekensis]SHN22838.1 Predicted amidohydrolase [Gracilibacillus kekensis]